MQLVNLKGHEVMPLIKGCCPTPQEGAALRHTELCLHPYYLSAALLASSFSSDLLFFALNMEPKAAVDLILKSRRKWVEI